MRLFKRMGPRVILVEHRGRLVGLVTVKDVLKYIATERHYTPTWSERVDSEDVSREALSWTRTQVQSLVSWCRRVFRR
jgi:chloride channel 3/4/5